MTGEETSILHENVQSGTAGRSAINCPTAAKTGTTSELIDAWLDGYNSEYSTVVWMGYPNRRVSMTDVHGEPQQGGYLPAEIWHAYMAPVTEGHPCAPLHEENNGIEFKPFYGKYATTGQALAKQNEASESRKQAKPKQPKGPKPAPQAAPKGPPPPAAETPAIEKTGGAVPKCKQDQAAQALRKRDEVRFARKAYCHDQHRNENDDQPERTGITDASSSVATGSGWRLSSTPATWLASWCSAPVQKNHQATCRKRKHIRPEPRGIAEKTIHILTSRSFDLMPV